MCKKPFFHADFLILLTDIIGMKSVYFAKIFCIEESRVSDAKNGKKDLPKLYTSKKDDLKKLAKQLAEHLFNNLIGSVELNIKKFLEENSFIEISFPEGDLDRYFSSEEKFAEFFYVLLSNMQRLPKVDKKFKNEVQSINAEEKLKSVIPNSTYQEAIHIYDHVLDLEDLWEYDPIFTVKIFYRLGKAQMKLDNKVPALEAFENALEKIDDIIEEGDLRMRQNVVIQERIAFIYRSMGRYDDAIDILDKIIEVYSRHKWIQDLTYAEIMNTKGVCVLNLENYDEALKCYEEALTVREKYKAPKDVLAYSYHNIGTAYQKKKDYDRAYREHKRALDLRIKINAKNEEIVKSKAMLGVDLSFIPDRVQEGIKYINEALKTQKDIYGQDSNHKEIAWSLFSLSNAYVEASDYQKAYDCAKESCLKRCNVSELDKNHVYICESLLQMVNLIISKRFPLEKRDNELKFWQDIANKELNLRVEETPTNLEQIAILKNLREKINKKLKSLN